MRTIAKASITAAFIVFLATHGPGTAAAGDYDLDEYWTVAEVQGAVTARTGANHWNQHRQLEVGDKVGPYSVIESGPDAEVLLVRAGERWARADG